MTQRLAGKIALITGSAQGIGKETAILFANEGATVIITDINDSLGETLQNEIGERSQYIHLDVSIEEDWKNAIDCIKKKYGKLHILVNNAGVTGFHKNLGPQDPENASLDSWKIVHSVNSDGVFLGCKYGIQIMKEVDSASIINISSRSGLVGIPGAAAYAASKASVRNHTKSVALYCCEKGYNIRCNSIHPAAILTPMWDFMLGDTSQREQQIASISNEIPMHRMGMPEEVAHAILFLASDESKYITGIELNVDGGILAGTSANPQKK